MARLGRRNLAWAGALPLSDQISGSRDDGAGRNKAEAHARAQSLPKEIQTTFFFAFVAVATNRSSRTLIEPPRRSSRQRTIELFADRLAGEQTKGASLAIRGFGFGGHFR